MTYPQSLPQLGQVIHLDDGSSFSPNLPGVVIAFFATDYARTSIGDIIFLLYDFGKGFFRAKFVDWG